MNKRVLIVITNHDTYPSKRKSTGLWLSELTHFHDVLDEHGYPMDLASPNGGAVPIDPRSLGRIYMDDATKRRYNDPNFMARLKTTLRLGDLDPDNYCAIFYTGGHGTMWDFPDNTTLQNITRNVYESGGVISAVCHGNGGLINTRLSDGSYLVAGKTVTGFSNLEETLSMVKKEVPFLLEDRLKQRGAAYRKALLPFTAYAVVDGRLITGQNPQSTKAVAERLVEVLAKLGENHIATSPD